MVSHVFCLVRISTGFKYSNINVRTFFFLNVKDVSFNSQSYSIHLRIANQNVNFHKYPLNLETKDIQ